MKIFQSVLIVLLQVFLAAFSSLAVPASEHNYSDLQILDHQWYLLPARNLSGGYPVLGGPCQTERFNYRSEVDDVDCRKEIFRLLDGASHGYQAWLEAEPKKFVYKIRLLNVGLREIASVHWEYVFSHPITGQLIERHRFETKTDLRPFFSNTLTETSLRPPTQVIDADLLAAPDSETYRESVEVIDVVYAD